MVTKVVIVLLVTMGLPFLRSRPQPAAASRRRTRNECEQDPSHYPPPKRTAALRMVMMLRDSTTFSRRGRRVRVGFAPPSAAHPALAAAERRPHIFWFAYLHDDDSSSCAWADELRSRVGRVAALLRQQDEEEEPMITTTPVVVRVASVALSPADRQRLQQQFGFTALPALVLVSSMSFSQSSSSPYMVEYTGPLQTAHELYRGVTHYFDRLSLTAQPMTGGGVGSGGSSPDKNNSSSTRSGRCNRGT